MKRNGRKLRTRIKVKKEIDREVVFVDGEENGREKRNGEGEGGRDLEGGRKMLGGKREAARKRYR